MDSFYIFKPLDGMSRSREELKSMLFSRDFRAEQSVFPFTKSNFPKGWPKGSRVKVATRGKDLRPSRFRYFPANRPPYFNKEDPVADEDPTEFDGSFCSEEVSANFSKIFGTSGFPATRKKSSGHYGISDSFSWLSEDSGRVSGSSSEVSVDWSRWTRDEERGIEPFESGNKAENSLDQNFRCRDEEKSSEFFENGNKAGNSLDQNSHCRDEEKSRKLFESIKEPFDSFNQYFRMNCDPCGVASHEGHKYNEGLLDIKNTMNAMYRGDPDIEKRHFDYIERRRFERALPFARRNATFKAKRRCCPIEPRAFFVALLCASLFSAVPQLTPKTALNSCSCLKSGFGLDFGLREPDLVDMEREIRGWEKKYGGQQRRLWTEMRGSVGNCSLDPSCHPGSVGNCSLDPSCHPGSVGNCSVDPSCRPGSLTLVSGESGARTTEDLACHLATAYSRKMAYSDPLFVDCALYHAVAPQLALEQIFLILRRKVEVEGARSVVFANFHLLPAQTTSLLFDVFSSQNPKLMRTLFLFTLKVDGPDWSDPEKWKGNVNKFLGAHLRARDPVAMDRKTSERLVALVTRQVGWVARENVGGQHCVLVDNT